MIDEQLLKIEFDKRWTTSAANEEVAQPKENKTYNVAMPTHNNIMKDKSVDYRLLAKISVDSKHSEGEGHNYIMKSDIDFTEIAKEFSLAKETVRKIFTKLKRADSKVVEAVNTQNGVAYKINYKTDDKFYITVNHNILRVLANATNAMTIKCYLVLCYELKNSSKLITKQWLAEKIGYSTKGNNYHSALTDILAVLGSLKLIEMKEEPHTVYNAAIGKDVATHIYRFTLKSYDTFKANYEETTKQKLK